MRKIITLGIMLLFLGLTISSSTGIDFDFKSVKPLSSGNTLYVGGNGPNNYSKINDAYDDANPGDTIFVYSGTYYEYLHIEKTINLIGENEDTTSIIYNHKSIEPISIETHYVVISGFTLYNPNPDHVRYIDIYSGYNHSSISNCIFYNSPLPFDDDTVGIGIGYSSHHRISNCTFLYNDDEGVCLNKMSSHNIVENCVFTGCCDGIEIRNSSYNIINNCIMKDGTHCGIGFCGEEPLTSDYNIIKNCKIYNNEQGGIYLSNGCNNVIYNCSLENNLVNGIHVRGSKSYNNLIVNNKVSGSTVDEGILLGMSCYNNIFSNNIISHNNYGAYI